jgi:hypothetical protein
MGRRNWQLLVVRVNQPAAPQLCLLLLSNSGEGSCSTWLRECMWPCLLQLAPFICLLRPRFTASVNRSSGFDSVKTFVQLELCLSLTVLSRVTAPIRGIETFWEQLVGKRDLLPSKCRRLTGRRFIAGRGLSRVGVYLHHGTHVRRTALQLGRLVSPMVIFRYAADVR